LFVNGTPTTVANNVFMSGFGTPESNGIGALRMNGKTFSGTITLEGATAVGPSGTGSAFTNKITGVGPLFIGAGSNNGSGTLLYGKVGTQNDYTGDTTINNTNALGGAQPNGANTLKINTGADNVMPSGNNAGSLVLNGVSATVNSPNASDVVLGSNRVFIAPSPLSHSARRMGDLGHPPLNTCGARTRFTGLAPTR